MSPANNTKATQEFVPISEIKDSYLLLKDGSMRAIVMASSLNFALKSGEEQTAIIIQFQNFLNSLNFSVQICVQSRRLNIKPYLELLSKREVEQTTDLMKLQVKQYIEFVRTLAEGNNIMTKNFFVVIPYSPVTFGHKNDKAEQKQTTFDENKSQLQQRVSVVEEGLSRCGIRIVELGTEELVELFYKSFNPGELEKAIHTS